MITWTNGGVYQVTALQRWNDSVEMRNVFDFQLITGTPMTYQEGLDDIEEWLTLIITVLKALQTTLHIWRGFTVSQLDGSSLSGYVPFAAPIAGVLTTDALPPGVAFLTYMNTGVSRRQPRKYWGGFTESAVGPSGGFSSSTVTAVAAIAPYFLTTQNMTNGDWIFCDAHAGVPGDTIYPMTFTGTAVPSYQRRRRQGRGI